MDKSDDNDFKETLFESERALIKTIYVSEVSEQKIAHSNGLSKGWAPQMTKSQEKLVSTNSN